MAYDYSALRDTVARYLELANSPEQQIKREMWRDHNSLRFTRPPIYAFAVPYREIKDTIELKSEDPDARGLEFRYKSILKYGVELGDDAVYEPWMTIGAAVEPLRDRWGVLSELGEKPFEGGAAAFQPQIVEETDIERLITRPHTVDEAATAREIDSMNEMLGGMMYVHADRRGILSRVWYTDIATDIARLRGLDQIMYDAYDRPEWLHKLCKRMQTAILKSIDETEQAGDFSLAEQFDYVPCYSHDLPDPDPHVRGVKTRELQMFFASQEMTCFGPEMFEEFCLNYQMPIMERFARISYGCCEDLTLKIPSLKKVKNLRRIGVTPFADIVKCAEQIGGDYVLSYRPHPTLVTHGFHEDAARKSLRADFDVLMRNGCKFEVMLKDVETLSGHPENLAKWVKVVRQEIDRAFG